MHFEKLDLNLLVALDALIAERSVSRAARKLSLGQSAMSAALSRLRNYFKDELLVPSGNQMSPTALGLALAPQVREILNRVRLAVQSRPTFDPLAARRSFRIMISDYLIEVLMGDVIRELATDAPGIQLHLLPTNDTSVAQFREGDIDVMLVPEARLASSHPRTVLFDETFSCVAWSGNARVQGALSLADWLSMEHVAVHLGRNQPTLLEQWIAEQDTHKFGTRCVAIIAPSFGVVPHLLIGTQRIATMHTRHAENCAAVLPLRVVPAPEGFPVLRTFAQWQRSLDTDPATRWLMAQITRLASDGARGSSDSHSSGGHLRAHRPFPQLRLAHKRAANFLPQKLDANAVRAAQDGQSNPVHTHYRP